MRETYEIMRAEDVGQVSESIRLGRHSGRHGLFSRLEKLGIAVADGAKAAIYEEFVKLADRKKEINDHDLFSLIDKHSVKSVTPHYRLDHMEVSVGMNRQPEASVRVEHVRTGKFEDRTATGDGPIDALYRAIDHAVDEAHDLVSYSIRSISEGADALGEVSVLISIGGPCFSGKARGTDVVHASAEAYLHALNTLASHRADEESIRFVNKGIIQAFHGMA
jgi:2-isopropylmalate synthase